ncbi:class I SAM-dependent methyltransferase [Desulfonatronum lacustre]|uniref:class I SAM-dependent methyltransferase n=1 Tax=Desulfonatronum lacustre TaxID=66849 RepID=UPI000A040547|nr:class I SAM-dependent methyltransferase [Desulfonatronum lacustre]
MPNRWDGFASIRQNQIESGKDLTFSKVFLPYYNDLVKELCPESLLEVGCGTGHLSVNICSNISTAVAIEPSEGMYAVAEQVVKESCVQLFCLRVEEYRCPHPFDLIISHMVLQLVDNLDLFIESVANFMEKESQFVFAIPHPCFYNNYKLFFDSSEYKYMCEIKKTISFSITNDPNKIISGVPYCHRPLSQYFSVLKKFGFYVVDFKEIFPDQEIQSLYGVDWKFPRYCVFHAQRKKGNPVLKKANNSSF